MKSTLLFGLFFSISFFGFAQLNSVTGIVYDEENNMLQDANIIVKNSDKGTITNQKGQFALDAHSKDTLIISYLGFETKAIVVGDQKEIKIYLKTKFEGLDAVIINAEKYYYRTSCGTTSTTVVNYYTTNISTTLFPNPSTNGLFQLQLNTTFDKLTIEVFNMNGQLIQTNTHTKLSKIPQIDVSTQPKGIYLIRTVVDGTLLETKKAIRS